MSESLNSVSEKSGLPPGSLIHVGDVIDGVTRLSVINYGNGVFNELNINSIDELEKFDSEHTVTWVIVEGLANVEIVERIGAMFDIHQLVLEDILNTHQRPKYEEYDKYLYIVLKCLLPKHDYFAVDYEQISILVFKNFVFTFKEKKDDLFLSIQQRMKSGKGRILTSGSDYLAYALLDIVVDQNFILIDSLDDTISSLEDVLLSSDPPSDVLNTIQFLRKEVISIRKHVSPVRELITGIMRSESELINSKTHVYLRDVYDHAVRITESIESYRELLTGLSDIYMSRVSNKMNETMKILTVFASIFIPLTFLAGIYGMNFEYMPELKWKWAYPTLWAFFIAIPCVLLGYFKRKKWL